MTKRYTTLMSRHEKRYVYDRMVNNGRKDYYGGIAEEGSLDGAAGAKEHGCACALATGAVSLLLPFLGVP